MKIKARFLENICCHLQIPLKKTQREKKKKHHKIGFGMKKSPGLVKPQMTSAHICTELPIKMMIGTE